MGDVVLYLQSIRLTEIVKFSTEVFLWHLFRLKSITLLIKVTVINKKKKQRRETNECVILTTT